MLSLLLTLFVVGSFYSTNGLQQGFKYGKVWNTNIGRILSPSRLQVQPSVGDTVLAEVDDIVGTLDRPAISLKVCLHVLLTLTMLLSLFINDFIF